ncbi:MAG: Hint domain-containing protein [Litoreibacter sp.]|uniref:Hint domain-containing protein n=1 Tax=Litoreibacter sp. TaxID=1969459 RepID=UPI003297841A
MPTSHTDQAYPVDIFQVNVGDALTVTTITLIDTDDDGLIEVGETINGFTITNVYVGDTVTVDGVFITGVTFTTSGGPFFTPNDGSILVDGTADARTFVTPSTSFPVDDLGPPCFVRGTLIQTPNGRVPIETLKVGDLVTTRDNGDQVLTWVGTARTHGQAQFSPVRFEIGSCGNTEVLEVSQQHQMLLVAPMNDLNFGTNEVLVAAKHLVGNEGVELSPRAHVDYIHLMFSQHEIICANGAWSESFFYGNQEVSGLNTAARQELESIFADDLEVLNNFRETARYCLKAHEAALVTL